MIEDRLQARFPHWFHGRRARMARPILKGVRRWSRLDAIESFVRACGDIHGLPFVRESMRFLDADYRIGGAGVSAIPAAGPVVVAANHPSGALDALALLDAIGQVRGDVRIVANDLLTALDGLRPLLLPVDVFGRGAAASVRAIDAALARGDCVVVFPAGEVARLGWNGVREGRWRDGFARLARRHDAPVVPVHVQARNSALFYGTSALFKPAATLLLAREMFARRGRPLQLTFGRPLRIAADERSSDVAARLRSALCNLRFDTELQATQRPLAPAEDTARIEREIRSLDLLGRTTDGKEIRTGRLERDSVLMRELGRLRELTFRAVGEGTGRERDIDAFDAHYDQIVLWDADARHIAGGYRVARVADVIATHGIAGLYTSTLFRFDAAAIARLAAGLELGRSFVMPDYWGTRSIDYLWQGIGAYIARVPWVRHLFGPVSISASLPEAARRDVVAFYARWHGADGGVHARKPFRVDAHHTDAADVETAFRDLRERLAQVGASVPMLYKQYVDLCDPGGARFLAFNVDPAFSDVIDGLVEIDLSRLRPQKRARYLRSSPEAAVA